MGGRGSASGKGTSGTWVALKTVPGSGNKTIDLGNAPLKYGQKDAALSGNARKTLEEFENKRYRNKIEFSRFIDAQGNVIEDNRGSKGSVKASLSARMIAAAMSHNHPRGADSGELGGTFSGADLRNFGNFNQTVYRATAAEGTYSIAKQAGFNAQGLNQYYSNIEKQLDKAYHAKVDPSLAAYKAKIRDYRQGKATYTETTEAYDKYLQQHTKAFNEELVGLHNALIDGQKKYGYSYTLERR